MTANTPSVVAVVVTYNRLQLLKRTIGCLRQIERLDGIIVVNNGSTDGTAEWLAAERGLKVISQANVGGSGGFHAGIKRAFDDGADWIWCMDDDVFPRPDSLEMLLKHASPGIGILCPRRMREGKVFVNECRGLDLSNPFKSLHKGKLDAKCESPTEISGMVFEGPLVSREVVSKIGLPNKDLFIFFDDTDYSYRAVLAGFKVVYVPEAVIDKEMFFSDTRWEEKQRKKKWKKVYQIRNSAYFNHHYGHNLAVKYLRAFNGAIGHIALAFICAPFSKAYSLSDCGLFWKAYLNGVKEKLN